MELFKHLGAILVLILMCLLPIFYVAMVIILIFILIKYGYSQWIAKRRNKKKTIMSEDRL